MNEELAVQVVQAMLRRGVAECCMCPGARNSPLYPILKQTDRLEKFFWFEERSAAFFALGRSKATNRPVAVITTSGTAAGELLPAAMEAYYTGIPLLLVTADRPARFRGTGAPQTAEQVNLYGVYTPFAVDVAHNDTIDLTTWDGHTPAHLNVCFEEPFPGGIRNTTGLTSSKKAYQFAAAAVMEDCDCPATERQNAAATALDRFLQKSRHPFVVVSTLRPEACEAVAQFLLQLQAPAYLEGVSGLREDPRLSGLRIVRTEALWQSAEKAGYPIDGVLRIGGVPTFRFWRDLEDLQGKVAVCSLNEVPFSGLSWSDINCTSLSHFFGEYVPERTSIDLAKARAWCDADRVYADRFQALCESEPTAEPSLVRALSQRIPPKSSIYLGNSLPIREWDLAACNQPRDFVMAASRGLNGIDGQISTFLGWSTSTVSNWAILGDLTLLYDLAGPWVLQQLQLEAVNIVVINNSGGQIFNKVCSDKEFINAHSIEFEPVAKLWGMDYEKWEQIPPRIRHSDRRLIEIVPDAAASERFWKKLGAI